VVKAYKSSGGADVTVAYGPTPVLAKNIADGAPADIFFSADDRWMDYLADRKLIRAENARRGRRQRSRFRARRQCR